MARIEKTIVVEAPVEQVYARWARFEEFPLFMDGIEQVARIDERTLEWKGRESGRAKRWTARIVDEIPDERIAWRSLEGAQNDGSIAFSRVGAGATRVRLVVDADPNGFPGAAGDGRGFLDRRVSGDLDRFKALIEEGRGASSPVDRVDGWTGPTAR